MSNIKLHERSILLAHYSLDALFSRRSSLLTQQSFGISLATMLIVRNGVWAMFTLSFA